MIEFLSSLDTPAFYCGVIIFMVICIVAIIYLLTHPAKRPNRNASAPPGLSSDSPFNAAIQDTLESDKQTIPTINEKVSKSGVFNAVVLDDAIRSIGERRVDLIQGKDYGRPLQFFNRQVFYLHRFRDGRIEPVPPSSFQNMEHGPGETYRAVKTFEYIKSVFGSRASKDHTKVWMILIAIGAVLFIAFMVVSSGGH